MRLHGKKLLLILSILLIFVSLSGISVFAEESSILVLGANGNATQIEKGTSMKMTVAGVAQGKSVTWSVTDIGGSDTDLAEITQTGALTAILTASSDNCGTFKVVAVQNDASDKIGEQVINITDANLVTVDDNDDSIHYVGAGSGEEWETKNNSSYYHGTGTCVIPPEDDSYSTSEPAYTEFTFTGTGIQWIGESNYYCGTADVYLDDVKVSTVDPFIAPSIINQFINYSKEGLPYGEHTIKVVAAGLKNPASTVYPGTRILIDAFRYIPGSPVQEVDKTELQAKITEAQALSETAYTPASWTALQQVLTTAVMVNEDPNASQVTVNAALEDLEGAITGLVPVGPAAILTGVNRVLPEETFTVGISLYHISEDVYAEEILLDYDANVFEYISVEGENSDIQIVDEESEDSGSVRIVAANIGGVAGESTPVLRLTFQAKSGVQNTSGNIAVTKAELGIAPEGTVINASVSSKTISIGSTETVDKSILSAIISSAEEIYAGAVVGDQPGQYPQAAKDALRIAIDAAGLVLNDSDADQNEVNNAVAALNTAVDAFKAAVIEEETSADLNEDETIDVVDLAIVAYYYGRNSDSEDWEQAKAADVNHDNKIDIFDLAYVATRIPE